jgi:DNA-binding NtrC family response regulator
MESELFGHERGSFTGADRRHRGFFEQAHGGTLFLDEVTELALELQVKLLRVLETGTLTRTGGEAPIAVDARIIAATNRQLDQVVAQSSLREDLFYRLKVFHIPVPPLRERAEDIELLCTHFLGMLAEKEGRQKQLSPDALEAMRRYAWPGNVRELRNAIYTAYLLADGDRIDARALPPEIESGTAITFDRSSVQIPVGTALAEAERRVILTTLARYEGNKPKAAEVLGVSLKTLYNRLHEYGYWGDRDEGAS